MGTKPKEPTKKPRSFVTILVITVSLGALGLAAALALTSRHRSEKANAAEILFRDDFERAELGERWHATDPSAVRIVNGALQLERVHNHPVWLKVDLPARVMITFDAWSESPDGDIKVEIGGDGRSMHAGGLTEQYTATGFVAVFGGWRNSASVLARGNEHRPDNPMRRDMRVQPNRKYKFGLVCNEQELTWFLDGSPFLSRLSGGTGCAGHFAFSGWETRVNFDNLVIAPLP